jgi:hypothetical protein
MHAIVRHSGRENRMNMLILILFTITTTGLCFPLNRIYPHSRINHKADSIARIFQVRHVSRCSAKTDASSDDTGGFQPVIAPYLRLPGMLTEKRNTQPFQSALDYNWISGMCQHKQIFEVCHANHYTVLRCIRSKSIVCRLRR